MTNQVDIIITGDDQSGAAFVTATARVHEYRRVAIQAGQDARDAIDDIADSADLATLFIQQMTAEFQSLITAAAEAVGGGPAEAMDETAEAAGDATEAVEDLASEVTEALEDVATEAHQAAEAVEDVGEAATEAAAEATVAAAATAEALDDVADEAHQAAEAVEDIGRESLWTRIKSFISGLIPSMSDVRDRSRSIGTSLMESIFSATDRLPDGIAGAIRAAGPAGAVAAGTVGVAVGAALVSAIAGVIAAGAGLAGIGVGISAALKDAHVTSAMEELKDTFAREFADIGQVFEGPVTRAINIIKSSFQGMDISNALAPLAASIEPLTKSLMNMFQAALPGIQNLMTAGAQLVEGMGNNFEALGGVVSRFADHLANVGPAGQSSLEVLIGLAGGFVDILGWVIEGLGLIWMGLVNIVDAVGLIDADSTADEYERLLIPVTETARAFNQLAEANKQAAEAQEAARKATEELHNALRGILDGAIALQEATWQLADSVEQNGHSLDMTNKKGMENVKIVAAMVDAANQQADAARESSIASGDAANAESKANAVRQAAIDKILEQATAMGFDRAQVQALIGTLQGLPTGDRYLNYTVRTVYQVQYDQAQQRSMGSGYAGQAQAAGMSTGGEVTGSGTSTSDSELRRLSVGEHVLTASEVQAAGGHRNIYRLRQALLGGKTGQVVADSLPGGVLGGAGGGGNTYVINNYSLDPQTAGDAIVRALESWTQSNGTLPSGWVSA